MLMQALGSINFKHFDVRHKGCLCLVGSDLYNNQYRKTIQVKVSSKGPVHCINEVQAKGDLTVLMASPLTSIFVVSIQIKMLIDAFPH